MDCCRRFCIIIGTVTPFVGGSTVAGFTSTLGRDETLTGRTDIWKKLIPVAMQHPIFGCGYGGFWTTETIEIHLVNEAHNGYLQIILELGFVGILFFSMFLLSSCKKAQRGLSYNYEWASLWICYLLMVVGQNITESTINNLPSLPTAIIIFLLVSFTAASSGSRKVREERPLAGGDHKHFPT